MKQTTSQNDGIILRSKPVKFGHFWAHTVYIL